MSSFYHCIGPNSSRLHSLTENVTADSVADNADSESDKTHDTLSDGVFAFFSLGVISSFLADLATSFFGVFATGVVASFAFFTTGAAQSQTFSVSETF